ncbi:MAG: hypothetical protein IJB59_09695 [Oscillospiraceae bacterium]|nr:hypothetical protein [Oscillospiraceae bacterium]
MQMPGGHLLVTGWTVTTLQVLRSKTAIESGHRQHPNGVLFLFGELHPVLQWFFNISET